MNSTADFISLLRPKHWIKNLFLFAAPLFGGILMRVETIPTAVTAFFAFSFCASAVYIANDIADRERDMHHPTKKHRAMASGRISVQKASLLAVALFSASLLLGLLISLPFVAIIASYAGIQGFYSFFGKNLPLLDILIVASGFVLRMFAGAIAFAVTVSPWLFICLFALSLVLATGKRYSELTLLRQHAGVHRASLVAYSPGSLQALLYLASGSAILFYCLYAFEHLTRDGFMIPFVIAGIVRYLKLAQTGLGEPTEALLHDRTLCIIVSLWLAVIVLTHY